MDHLSLLHPGDGEGAVFHVLFSPCFFGKQTNFFWGVVFLLLKKRPFCLCKSPGTYEDPPPVPIIPAKPFPGRPLAAVETQMRWF